MAKFCGNLQLLKNEEKVYDNYLVKGIKNQNKIVYLENDITVTLFCYDNKIEMKRETDEYLINFSFEKGISNQATYLLKDCQKTLPLEITTENIIYKENIIMIDYLLFLENEKFDHFVFTLELEV